MPKPTSKLACTLALVAMVAAINLAGMTATAQAHTSSDPTSTRHRALGRMEFLATADHAVASHEEQPTADATVRRLLARERSSIPKAAASAQSTGDATRAALAQGRYYSTWGYGGDSAPAAPAPPSGQPAWLVIALVVLVAVLTLVAGVAVLAARRTIRDQHAGQTA
jgi:hypothetical protein